MKVLKITYLDGSYQIVKPTQEFDGNWFLLAQHIAGNNSFRHEIL
jgi:hypothetical protein